MTVLSTLQALLPALVPALTVIGGLAASPGRLRRALRHDAETLSRLKENSQARQRMEEVLVAEIDELARRVSGTRQVSISIMATVVAAGFGYLAVWLFIDGPWWQVILSVTAFIAAAFFVYGAIESGQKVPRSERGTRTPPDKEA